MVIYLDQAFLLNSLLDYLLLVLCGTVTATPLKRRRILLSAALGGLYAAGSLAPRLAFLGKLYFQVLMAVLLCIIAFGPGRGLLRRTVGLWMLAAAFSGVVMVMTELFSAPAALVGSRVYYPVSLGVLTLTAGSAFSLMQWGLGRLTHQGGDLARVRVRFRGREATFTALRDTGNTLRDPISGTPVLVTDGDVLKTLLPEARAAPEELRSPGELAERLGDMGLRPRLIPYKTVGVERGLLLALRPEDVEVDGAGENLLLAFSPDPVSDGGGYQALLGGVL